MQKHIQKREHSLMGIYPKEVSSALLGSSYPKIAIFCNMM